MRQVLLAGLMLAGMAAAADAQPYGYPPGPPPPGYPPPPGPPGYYPPPYERPRPIGGRCDAFFRTPYGPRRFVCPMGEPKPIGAFCHCPAPDPYAPPARGRVIP